jgi:hypothetical protein
MFGKRKSKYPITEAQAQERAVRSLMGLAYLVVTVLILITGAHAVMLVLSESAAFTLAGYSGILLILLTALRIGFPLVVEMAAAISTIGAIKGYWRGDQKSWAGRIDATWFLFAAANMLTFFTIERGAELETWQRLWLNYGLPISGIVAGVFAIKMILADPDHQRAEENSAAEEERTANEFNARTAVQNSDAMKLVEQRKVWRDYANGLRAKGYTDAEIDFILSHVPELSAAHRAAPAPTPAAPDPSVVDRLLSAVGINRPANDAMRHELAAASTAPGQGASLRDLEMMRHAAGNYTLADLELMIQAAKAAQTGAPSANGNGQEVFGSSHP